MRILFINQTFHPDPAATAQQLTDFSVDLAARGWDVTILTAKRGYAEPKTILPAREVYRGVNVLRVWPFTFGRASRFGRTLDAFFLNLSFAWCLLWFPRFGCIVAMTSPPLVGWISMHFAKWRRSQFVYWMMDVNPDEAIAAGWIKEGSPAARFLEGALKSVLKGSDKIVVLDRFMKERVIAKGAAAEKIGILPPWSHDDDLETIPHEKNPFRHKNSLNGKFVVMYSGNHSVCHPLDTLLGAAKELKMDPSVVFIFIGGGERVKDVLRFKEEHNLSNVLYFPYQQRSELKHSLSAADLHTVVMGDPFVGIVHPCKIYGILRIGRPFVYTGPRESTIGELISAAGIGYQVNHGDIQELLDVIRRVRGFSPTEKTAIQKRASETASQYSRQKLSPQLADFIE